MFVFVETRLVREEWDEEEYRCFQLFLAEQPTHGDVIPGTGGVRKIRWQGSGRGKRGELRVIYLLRRSLDEIWLLTLYRKNTTSNLDAATLRKIKEEIDGLP